MMKRILLYSLICILVVVSSISLFADTGTYEIEDYKVMLTPKSDGLVTIDYYQKWKVTSGNIPWITVGTPNSNFTIQKSELAVKDIQSESGSDFSGVRIDLDKDYKPGEIFEVSFSIEQNNLFYADDTNYICDFTPGWYDNAVIKNLEISIKFFANVETVKATPEPDEKNGEVWIWRWTDMAKGEKANIKVSFPKSGDFQIPDGNIASGEGNSQSGMGLLIFVIIVIIIVLIIISNISGGYSGGNIFYGGGFGGSRGSGGSSGRSSGGGGGFGGRSSSCACACVSCACACACAGGGGGGGGAGCSRKKQHTCKVCSGKNEEKDEKI